MAWSQANAQVTTGTDLFLTLTGWGVTINGPASINFGTLAVSSSVQTVEANLSSPDYLYVDDLNGYDAGYYTTLQSTALTTTGFTIPAANVALKVDPLTISLLAGSANPLVTFGPSIATTYLAIDSPVVFIRRDTAANTGTVWQYGALPSLEITIPAYASRGLYTGELLYTLYEN